MVAATDVTVIGQAGATISVPFTSSDNYTLAQYGAAAAIDLLPDSSKFVATGTSAVTTGALGIISNVNGASITGTAANASVIAGGSGISYTASGNGQSVFYSAFGTGNMLANGAASVGTNFYVDAGGNPSTPGTTLNATLGTATVNAYSGYLDILAGTGSLVVNDHGGAVSVGALPAGGNLQIYANGTSVPTPKVTVTGVGAQITSDVAVGVQVNAGDAVTVAGMLNGSLFSDTVNAVGNASVTVERVSAAINQLGGGTVSVNSLWAGHTTVNAAYDSTDTVIYTGQEGIVVNGGGFDDLTVVSANNATVNSTATDRVTLAGGGNFVITGSGVITNSAAALASISGSGAVTLAGGVFSAGAGPSITAIGSDLINSGVGIGVSAYAGSAVTVQGYAGTAITDTVTAGANSTVVASGLRAVVNQTGAGNIWLGSAWAGQSTVNPTAYANESISYTGAEGVVIQAGSSDNLSLTGGGFFTVLPGVGDTITGATGTQVSLAGSGAVTVNGGYFFAGTGPSITAAGSGNVINSGTGIGLTLANGAAVSVQGYPATSPLDTITALGSGSIKVTGQTAVVNQTGAGNLYLDESYAGQVTVNAAAGASETITVSTVSGVSAHLNLGGGNYTLAGGTFFANTTGNNTISASSAASTTVTIGAASKDTLAGGLFVVNSAGAGAGITFGANDMVYFGSGVDVNGLLGATAVTADTITASGTYIATGTLASALTLHLGATNDVVYFGTPFRTDAWGYITEAFAPSLVNKDITVQGGTGSQTLFGAGNAYQFGVVNQMYGGTAGNNLLVGAYTIVGGGAGDTLVAGAFTQSIKASAGNTTLIGGDANSVNYLANETLLGGAGNDAFIFGTGNETVTGGAGADNFTDLNRTTAGTTITIADFASGTDVVDLFSLTNAAGSGATANVTGQTKSGSDTLVQLSDGVTIRFAGVGSVSASDFVTNIGAVQVGKVV